MDTLQYLKENKEWLFSGAGVSLITLVIFGGQWLWRKYRKKPMSSDSKHKADLPPAFDLDNSAAKLTRTPIVGGVPHGLVKAKNGGTFEMSDSIIAVVGPNVECPPPNGELSGIDSQVIKEEAFGVAALLRQFDREMSAQIDAVVSAGKLSQLESISRQSNYRFNADLRHRALSLMSELLHRLPPIERQPLPVEMRCGIDAAVHGELIGSHAAAGLASFLELLATQIPE